MHFVNFFITQTQESIVIDSPRKQPNNDHAAVLYFRRGFMVLHFGFATG